MFLSATKPDRDFPVWQNIFSLFNPSDLEGIYEYSLTNWGVDQFLIYRGGIENGLKAVAANPILPGSKARDDLLEAVRLYRVEHHCIAYRVRSRRVEVGRILHESMHFDAQVSDEEFDSLS